MTELVSKMVPAAVRAGNSHAKHVNPEFLNQTPVTCAMAGGEGGLEVLWAYINVRKGENRAKVLQRVLERGLWPGDGTLDTNSIALHATWPEEDHYFSVVNPHVSFWCSRQGNKQISLQASERHI